MNVPRPTREDLKALINRLIDEAEANNVLRRAYTWHRRFAYGIDPSIESAEKRVNDVSLARYSKLQKSVEMALFWLRAQQEPDSAERELLLSAAWQLFEGLTTQ